VLALLEERDDLFALFTKSPGVKGDRFEEAGH
jgi:hypothetical protein